MSLDRNNTNPYFQEFRNDEPNYQSLSVGFYSPLTSVTSSIH